LLLAGEINTSSDTKNGRVRTMSNMR
jgi:hypothetical protein